MTAKLTESELTHQFAVQIVSVYWTKRSRGFPAADKRNQIARAFPLLSHTGHFHVIERRDFREADGGEFACASIRTGPAMVLPCKIDGLVLEWRGNQLLVRLKWDKGFHGMPLRHSPSRTLTIAAGETAQISMNGRHSADTQWYTQHCYNIAFAETIAHDVFTRSSFSHLLNLEENLF